MQRTKDKLERLLSRNAKLSDLATVQKEELGWRDIQRELKVLVDFTDFKSRYAHDVGNAKAAIHDLLQLVQYKSIIKVSINISNVTRKQSILC